MKKSWSPVASVEVNCPMGILSTMALERRSLENPNTPITEARLAEILSGEPTWTGVNVNDKVAMTLSAVFACQRILSNAVAMLPCFLFRRREGTAGRDRATGDPRAKLVARKPNPELTATEWFRMCQHHLLTNGNSYSEIEFSRMGEPLALWPLLANRTRVERKNGAKIYWTWIKEGDAWREVPLSDRQVLHIPGLGYDGLRGYNPIQFAKQTIGIGLAQQELTGRFFANGAHLGYVLQTAATLSPNARKNLETTKQELLGGLNRAHRLAILEEGLKLEKVGATPQEALLPDLERLTVEAVCRIFGVPLHMVASLDKPSYASQEQESLDFVTHCLTPWLVLWEQRLSRTLLREEEQDQMFFEFQVQGLLRGDPKTRAQYLHAMKLDGNITTNEVRQLENWNPIDQPEADEIWMPVNMVPLSQASSLDASKEPVDGGVDATRSLPRVSLLSADDLRARAQASHERAALMRERHRRAHLPIFEDVFQRLMREDAGRIGRAVDSIEADGPLAGALAEITDYFSARQDEVERSLRPILSGFAHLISASVGEELGEDESDGERTVSDLDRFISEFAKGAARRHVEISRQLLVNAAQSDTAAPAKAMRDEAATWPSSRAMQASKVESVRATGAITQEALALRGWKQKQWINLEASCSLCAELHGRTTGVRQPFLRAGDFVGEGTGRLEIHGNIGHAPLHGGCVCGIAAG